MKHIFGFIAVAMCLMLADTSAFAQTAGDMRSAQTGNWNDVGTWEQFDGADWIPQGIAVAATATSAKTVTTGTAHDVTLPAGITTGDLLLIFWTDANDVATDPGTPSGWTELYSSTATNRIRKGWYRVADGSETSPLSITAGAERSAHTAYRILAGSYVGVPVVSTIDVGTDDNPDPPSLTSGFGAVPTLWIATSHSEGDGTVTAPTNYTTTLIVGHSGGTASAHATTGTAHRVTTAATENPGIYDLAGNRVHAATTVAIQSIAAGSSPTSADGVTTIRSGHTVTITADVTVDQVVVEAGGQVTVSGATTTMTIADGTGTDMSVSGTLATTSTENTSGIITTGTLAFNAGGTYTHAVNGEGIPTASWAATSTLNLTGVTTTWPTGMAQTFSNITFAGTGGDVEITTVPTCTGDFTVAHTGTGALRLTDGATDRSFDVDGNFIHSDGEFRLTNSTGDGTMTVDGSVTVSGGAELILVSGASGIGTLNVGGDFNLTGGTVNMKEDAGVAALNITGDFIQTGGTFDQRSANTGGTATVDVDGDFSRTAGTYDISGVGAVGTLNVAGDFTNGATGSFTESGTGSGLIVFNGTGDQTITMGGAFTAANVINVTINKASGNLILASDFNVTGASTLTMTQGNVVTSANALILGSSGTSFGVLSHTSGTVVGNFRRFINAATGARLFPVGTATSYRPVTIDFTAAPTAGSLEATFIEGLPGNTGLPITDPAPIPQDLDVMAQAGVWRVTAVSGIGAAAYTITALCGDFPNISDETTLRIVKRPVAGSWTLTGSQGTNSGPLASPTVVRTGMSGFSEFGIASSSLNNPLPVQLASFTGAVVENNRVRLNWRTISEVNNYGFYVQKRAAGITSWTELGFVAGHGTTNEPQNYTYTDNSGITGSTQYRLKQVDFDGTTFFTEPILVDLPTSVPEVAPKQFALMQNYPNPFNPSTEIKFSVENTGHATLVVYNSLGQQVATLFDAVAEAGRYNTVSFNAAGLSSGVYFYRLQSGQKSELKKLMLLK